MTEIIAITISAVICFGLTWLFHKGVEYGEKEGLVKRDPGSRGEK